MTHSKKQLTSMDPQLHKFYVTTGLSWAFPSKVCQNDCKIVAQCESGTHRVNEALIFGTNNHRYQNIK